MNDKNTDFPQYRKLSNDKTFYKIQSDRLFEEVQLMGSKVFRYVVEAKQYPEILKIQDMLQLEEPYLTISEEEFTQKTAVL
jgi:hypothetical protein